MNIGDVIRVNGYEARVHDINGFKNGIGVVYIEGPKKGWEDWVMQPDNVEIVRKDIITDME